MSKQTHFPGASLYLAGFLLLGAALLPVSAMAQEESSPMATHEKMKTDAALSMEKNQKERTLFDDLGHFFQTKGEDIAKVFMEIKRYQDIDEAAPMPFSTSLLPLASSGVNSNFLRTQVKEAMNQTTREVMAGKKQVQDATSGSDANPAAGSALEFDARVYETMEAVLCSPESVNASDACAKRKDELGIQAGETLADLFTGEKTWSDSTVLDLKLVMQRIVTGPSNKPQLGYATQDGTSYIAGQSSLAKNNLRMSIINDLASRRAPVSTAGAATLGMMLKMQAMSGAGVMSTDADKVCDPKNLEIKENDADNIKSAKFSAASVCAHATRIGNGQLMISPAAISRVMEYDFYTSPNYYEGINSPNLSRTSLMRLQVFNEALQAVQKYNGLKLMQRKIALKAMLSSK